MAAPAGRRELTASAPSRRNVHAMMPRKAACPTSWGCGVAEVRLGPVEGLLQDVWREVSGLHDGEIATYIPELAKADPATCGISLATLDGQIYVAGDLTPLDPAGVQAVRLRPRPGGPR